jgi:aubergine-like protein
VLRDESFLETMNEEKKNRLSPEEINLKFQNHPILRKYGSPKIYKIEEIDYKMSPKDTFYDSKQGKDVTYLEYFKERYGAKVKVESQPLIKVLADRRFNKSNNPQDKQYIYLVPEMVCLTGLTDEQSKNFRIMKSLGEFTKLSAQSRMK